MADLPAEVHRRIRILCAEGDTLANKNEYPAALERYGEAWELLPEPQTQWPAATWILAAIGDARFQSKDFKAGADALTTAMECPDSDGNPFLHLRLGQCLFELGELDRAAFELAQAAMSVGLDIFDHEDGKYVGFLRSRLGP